MLLVLISFILTIVKKQYTSITICTNREITIRVNNNLRYVKYNIIIAQKKSHKQKAGELHFAQHWSRAFSVAGQSKERRLKSSYPLIHNIFLSEKDPIHATSRSHVLRQRG